MITLHYLSFVTTVMYTMYVVVGCKLKCRKRGCSWHS